MTGVIEIVEDVVLTACAAGVTGLVVSVINLRVKVAVIEASIKGISDLGLDLRESITNYGNLKDQMDRIELKLDRKDKL